jgi:hypothetical protein
MRDTEASRYQHKLGAIAPIQMATGHRGIDTQHQTRRRHWPHPCVFFKKNSQALGVGSHREAYLILRLRF